MSKHSHEHGHDHDDDKKILDALEAIKTNTSDSAASLDLLTRTVKELVDILTPPPLKADTFKLTLLVQGEPMGQSVTVPSTLSGGTSQFVESIAATGQILPPPGPKGITYASSDPTVATIDSVSGVWAPVANANGVTNITALDQDNGGNDTVVLTVTVSAVPVADTFTLTLQPNATSKR